MSNLSDQMWATIIVLAAFILIQFIARRFIESALKKYKLNKQRRKLIVRGVLILSSLIAVISMAAIWGVQKGQILVFVSSALTLLGVAFVAQWSILSNITASIILFFSHPLKLGSTIRILDKDYPLEGKIEDITFFFVHIKTTDQQYITIPNNILLQKSISVIAID